MPRGAPALPGFDFAARCLPARQVGGDFFDWHEPAPGVLTLTLGDVMGKGLPAALLMATVRPPWRRSTAEAPPPERWRPSRPRRRATWSGPGPSSPSSTPAPTPPPGAWLRRRGARPRLRAPRRGCGGGLPARGLPLGVLPGTALPGGGADHGAGGRPGDLQRRAPRRPARPRRDDGDPRRAASTARRAPWPSSSGWWRSPSRAGRCRMT
jgi:hypothetical protein